MRVSFVIASLPNWVEMASLLVGVAILSAVLVCVHDGSASSIGQNNLLDADQQNMTTPTTSPVTASPLCPGKQDLLHVEASDEARKALVGWLAKDTARLIFIYFDLVVGNLTYHPGSCPDDGMSAIDAQTPLAWVLTSGGPDGGPGAPGSHSFAHAYLTLPVSFPRLYSLGILEGHYVATLRHEAYRMKVVVDNSTFVDSESRWKSLNKSEKLSLMFDVVESFVSNLYVGVASQNTSLWRMCYSDPIGEDLPFSSSPLIPHTPAYVCRDERGSLQRLKRDPLLKGLLVLFVLLAIGALALQYYAISKTINFIRNWGEADEKRTFFTISGSTLLRDNFFNSSRLPVHMAVGNVLSSEDVLGSIVFSRLKWTLLLSSCCLLYAVWPVILLHSLRLNSAPVTEGFDVSLPETFGRNLCGKSLANGHGLKDFTYSMFFLGGPFFFFPGIFLLFIYFALLQPKYVWVGKPKQWETMLKLSNILYDYSSALSRLITSLNLWVLCCIRALWQFPASLSFRVLTDGREKDRTSSVTKTVLSFLVAQLLFWSVWVSGMLFLTTLGIVGEILKFSGILAFFISSFKAIKRKFMGEDSSDAMSFLTFLSYVYFDFAIIFFYIQGSEVLTFTILSSVSLYITFPLQTFLIVSWSLALVVEIQNILHDYRSPLLVVQEKTMEIIKTLVGERITYAVGKKDKSILTSRLCLRAPAGEMEEEIDWKKFFEECELLQDQVCLRLLTGGGDDEEFCEERDIQSFKELGDQDTKKHRSDDQTYIVSMVECLDVRQPTYAADVRQKLQKALWSRLSLQLTKLIFLVVLFLSIVLLLLAFNLLWKDPRPEDINSLLLTILIVPMYTFVRTRLGSSSVTDQEKMLIRKLLDDGLQKSFDNSKVVVSIRMGV